MPFHLYFRWLPGYFIALISYTALQLAFGRKISATAVEPVAVSEGSR
jgi:hypothetical protein